MTILLPRIEDSKAFLARKRNTHFTPSPWKKRAPKAIRMAPEGAPNPQGLALYVITEEIIVSLPALTHRQRGMIKRRERGERAGGGAPPRPGLDAPAAARGSGAWLRPSAPARRRRRRRRRRRPRARAPASRPSRARARAAALAPAARTRPRRRC